MAHEHPIRESPQRLRIEHDHRRWPLLTEIHSAMLTQIAQCRQRTPARGGDFTRIQVQGGSRAEAKQEWCHRDRPTCMPTSFCGRQGGDTGVTRQHEADFFLHFTHTGGELISVFRLTSPTRQGPVSRPRIIHAHSATDQQDRWFGIDDFDHGYGGGHRRMLSWVRHNATGNDCWYPPSARHSRWSMRLQALLPSLFCLVACSTNASSEEVLFQVRMPDSTAMLAKSQQGLWKQMLDLPSMQAFQAWSLRQSGIEVADNAEAWDASPFPQDLDLAVLHAAPGAVPRVIARADYGDQVEAAETLFASMLNQFTEQGMTLPGALRREGTRLRFDDGGPVAWPEAPLTGTADIVAVMHTDAMARAFGQFGRRIQNAFALGAWRGEFRITPEAYYEGAELTARWPTLAPLDLAQMRGLPRAALFGAAIGIDGFALEEWALAVAGDLPEFTLGLATLDERCTDQGLPPFTDALFGLNGTAWVAVLPGAPFPTVTLAIPAGTGVDAFVDALGTQANVDLAAARTAAVMLPVPPRMPIPVMIRRSATHWLLSTDMLGIEDFAAGIGDAFDDRGIAVLAAGATPVGVVWSDNQLTFHQLAGFMGMAQAAMHNAPAEQQEQFALMTTMMRDMAAILPPSLGVFTADATTLRMRGENMVFNMGLWGGIGAGMGAGFAASAAARAPAP